MSILLQTTDGDLDLTSDKKLTLVTDAADACAIKLLNKFRSVRGEWFLDTRVGVPYFESIFGRKELDLGIVKQIFREVLLTTEPVVSVETIDVNLTPDRVLQYSFSVVTDEGARITGGSLEPFIVEVR